MRNKRNWLIGGAIALVFALGLLLGRGLPERDAPTTAAAKVTEREIVYYKNPMGSGHISATPMEDEMGMPYIPVYADEVKAGSQAGVVVVDPRTVQSIGVRTAQVSLGTLASELTLNGTLAIDETRQTTITNRVPGYLEKLYVSAPGQTVQAGAPLYEIYSQELIALVEELHAAQRYQTSLPPTAHSSMHANATELIMAARKRLELTGLERTEIARLARTSVIPRTLTINAPTGGVILSANVVQGAFIPASTELFKLADLSSLWVLGDVYEQDLPKIRVGQAAAVSLQSFPGRHFNSRVDFIYPRLDDQRKTVKIRLRLANPGRMLRPGMTVKIALTGAGAKKQLLVPKQAVLRTGNQDIVILALGEGRFQPRKIELGGADANNYVVTSGLEASDTVVTSAQFLLDSESNIQAVVQQLTQAAEAAAPAPSPASSPSTTPAPAHVH